MPIPAGRLSRWILPLLGVALAVLGACTANYPRSSLAPESDFARTIDGLFRTITLWGLIVFVLVEALLLFVIFRYRHRPGETAEPRHVHGHTRLELAWTMAPALILVFIAVPTIRTIFVTQDEKPIPGALNVRVVGHQWWWEFEIPELEIVTANELHIPAGRTTSFQLESADVIHSFWVPQLGGKRDVIPRHTNQLWFTPERPGTYVGQCAEFCGLSHALMGLRVVVDAPADFEAWVANQRRPAVGTPPAGAAAPAGAAGEAPPGTPPTPPGAPTGPDTLSWKGGIVGAAAKGAQIAQGVCAACHTINGTNARGRVGPNLTHVASRVRIGAELLDNTPPNMARWIQDPPALKPGAKMPNLGLKEQQIADLVAYLQTLE